MRNRLILRILLAAAAVAALGAALPTPAHAQRTWAIYVMNADGGDVKKITNDTSRFFGSPIWSHDGKRLAYDGWISRLGPREGHIFVQPIGDEKATDVGAGNTPSFSPDDQQIAFMRGQDNPAGEKAGVWVMNADGANREWICEGERPRWSPDGEKLVCVSNHEGYPSLYVYDTISLERSRILDRGYSQIIGASFSPDSGQLVFVGYKSGNANPNTNGEVAVVDAKPGAPPAVVFQGHVGWHPDWSASGKKLLFRTQQGPIERIEVLDLELGGKPVPLPNQLGRRNSDATWSPDGKQIVFSSDRG